MVDTLTEMGEKERRKSTVVFQKPPLLLFDLVSSVVLTIAITFGCSSHNTTLLNYSSSYHIYNVYFQ